MVLILPSQDEGPVGTILEQALAHYDEALDALNILKLYMKDRDDISGAEIQRVTRDYRAATQTLFNERERLESLRKKDAGIVHDYALDLGAARAEVGGLLDRLRAAGGAGGVP